MQYKNFEKHHIEITPKLTIYKPSRIVYSSICNNHFILFILQSRTACVKCLIQNCAVRSIVFVNRELSLGRKNTHPIGNRFAVRGSHPAATYLKCPRPRSFSLILRLICVVSGSLHKGGYFLCIKSRNSIPTLFKS